MRTRRGSARRRAKKRWFRAAEGYVMGRRKLLRTVKEAVLRARRFAWIGRRLKKRDYRALWIIRITAACRARGIRYSAFIHGLLQAGVSLNRKMLSEIAIYSPPMFDQLVAIAREHAAQPAAA
jgi:large subunit ribosomal protein L20